MTNKTALYQTHLGQKAKMMEFAGYQMPIEYPLGMLKEHQWVRDGNVGLFDVSHMGQLFIEGNEVAKFLSKITPSTFDNIPRSSAKYTILTNENGGIIDDLIITKINDNNFFIVINAACKEKDLNWIKKNLPKNLKITTLENRSLIAVQGAKAAEILTKYIEFAVEEIPYMSIRSAKTKNGDEIFISRTGYTGEDGFEISIANDKVADFWQKLSAEEYVNPIGLGARDTLRLEVGYPLYGHDLNDKTSPIEAGLSWVIGKENDNFIGYQQVKNHKENGVSRRRLGVKLLEKGIARKGAKIYNLNDEYVGCLTSGGFSPNLQTSIGQAYIDLSKAKKDDKVKVLVRNKKLDAIICSAIFVKISTKSNKK